MITPRQFLSLRAKDALAIEAEIDEGIRKAAQLAHAHVDIAIGEWDRDTLEQVLRDYRRAGWKADYHLNCYDGGTYIRLEVP